ncbi:MAG: hypothetical protein ABIZ91_07065 [Gemmatimonadaceae bacterium]
MTHDDAVHAADALAQALREQGLSWNVAARDRLAVLTPRPEAGTVEIDPALRRWVVQAAQRAGFSHVAIEVPDRALSSGATLPGRQPV